jgi:hypothetical protein
MGQLSPSLYREYSHANPHRIKLIRQIRRHFIIHFCKWSERCNLGLLKINSRQVLKSFEGLYLKIDFEIAQKRDFNERFF